MGYNETYYHPGAIMTIYYLIVAVATLAAIGYEIYDYRTGNHPM